MTEPHSSVIGACIGAACAVPASWFGADVLALALGLSTAVASSIIFPTVDTRPKAFASVFIAALLAAYGTPFALANASLIVPGVVVPTESATPLMAIIIGLLAPIVVPKALAKVWKKEEVI